jgi:hypothetical protein
MTRFYQRFFPYLLRQVGEDRYVLLNCELKPIGMPAALAADPTWGASTFQLELEDHHVRELEALGARATMEGIYLFENSADPNESGASFSEYANRLQALSDLILK